MHACMHMWLQGHQESPPSDAEVDALRAALEQARQEAGQGERALQTAQLESGLARQMLEARPFLGHAPCCTMHSGCGPVANC